MRHLLLLAIGVPLVVSGCSTTWSKPGATPRQRDLALDHCRALSYSYLPAAPVRYQVSPAGFASGSLECRPTASGYNHDCRPAQVYRDAVYGTRDANRDGRDAILRDCMQSDGWVAQD